MLSITLFSLNVAFGVEENIYNLSEIREEINNLSVAEQFYNNAQEALDATAPEGSVTAEVEIAVLTEIENTLRRALRNITPYDDPSLQHTVRRTINNVIRRRNRIDPEHQERLECLRESSRHLQAKFGLTSRNRAFLNR